MGKKVAVLVGSLREGSFNKKLAMQVIKLGAEKFDFQYIEIGNLPLYNEDLDHENPPKEWESFRDQINSSEAFLFFTPEYNRSVPGALKNALDVASRPPGKGGWAGKPGAVISVTKGKLGAFGAHHHLRQILVSLGVETMAKPEAYIGEAESLFLEDGSLVEKTEKYMEDLLSKFDLWVNKLS